MATRPADSTRCTRKDPSLCRIHGTKNSKATLEGGRQGAVKNELLEAGEKLFNSIIHPDDQELALKVLDGRDLWLVMPSGSRLYNLATPTSDRDYYLVTAPENSVRHEFSRQEIVGDADVLMVDFPTFVKHSSLGVPRAAEAMFTTLPHPTPLDAFRQAFRVTGESWQHKHRGMVRDAYGKGEDQDLPEEKRQKNRRHALRLLRNMLAIGQTGTFRPELSPDEVEWVHRLSKGDDAAYQAEVAKLTQVTGMNWSELFDPNEN